MGIVKLAYKIPMNLETIVSIIYPRDLLAFSECLNELVKKYGSISHRANDSVKLLIIKISLSGSQKI